MGVFPTGQCQEQVETTTPDLPVNRLMGATGAAGCRPLGPRWCLNSLRRYPEALAPPLRAADCRYSLRSQRKIYEIYRSV